VPIGSGKSASTLHPGKGPTADVNTIATKASPRSTLTCLRRHRLESIFTPPSSKQTILPRIPTLTTYDTQLVRVEPWTGIVHRDVVAERVHRGDRYWTCQACPKYRSIIRTALLIPDTDSIRFRAKRLAESRLDARPTSLQARVYRAIVYRSYRTGLIWRMGCVNRHKDSRSSLRRSPGWVLMSMVSVCLSGPVHAVDRFVPLQYSTLRAAMDAASPADTIVVAPGVYSGSENCDLDFEGKSITIRGTSPSDPAVVASTIFECRGDDSDPHRAFEFRSGEGNDARLVGLTISGGYAPITQIGPWPRRTGGAILCVNSSPTIDRCIFLRNEADYGGAIACWGQSRPWIVSSTFVANSATVDGAAVFARDSSLTIKDCTFHSNSGNVISNGGTGSSMVLASTLRENAGRAIRFAQGTGLVSRCILANNHTPNGDGIPSVVEMYGSHVIVDNCLIDGNDAVGVLGYGGAPVVRHSTLVANEVHATFDHPIWIDTPDQVASIAGTARGYWNGRFWSFQSRRLVAFDGLNYVTGGLARPEHTPRRTYFNGAGAFLFSHHDGEGFLEKSSDGFDDFQTVFSGIQSEGSLPRSLVWCGPTDEHAGVMFYFEYAASPRILVSTDAGESWSELFQCAADSIRHFHGSVFAPLVGGNEGRLYVMTGDINSQSSILVCDDIDDLIANPATWQVRWGLDVADERRIEQAFAINDDLDSAGTPTSQVFRSVDLLIASDGYGYWTVDSALSGGQSVHRVNQVTKSVERVGIGNAIGAGWLWLETKNQDRLFLTEVGVDGSEPKPGHDVFVHLYGLTAAGTDFVELRRWIRADAAMPAGPTIPQYFFEALGHLWISVTSGALEYGVRNMVGRIEAPPVLLAPGVHSWDAALSLENNIVWNNRRGDNSEDDTPQIAGNTISIRYSNIEGWPQSFAGPGNMSEDPRFTSIAGTDGIRGTEDDNLRLLPDSPCIDAGDPAFEDSPSEPDLDSSLRSRCTHTDMGAYEFGFGDYDCDRAIGLVDFENWSACMANPPSVGYPPACSAFDTDANDRIDLVDYAAFQTRFLPG